MDLCVRRPLTWGQFNYPIGFLPISRDVLLRMCLREVARVCIQACTSMYKVSCVVAALNLGAAVRV